MKIQLALLLSLFAVPHCIRGAGAQQPRHVAGAPGTTIAQTPISILNREVYTHLSDMVKLLTEDRDIPRGELAEKLYKAIKGVAKLNQTLKQESLAKEGAELDQVVPK